MRARERRARRSLSKGPELPPTDTHVTSSNTGRAYAITSNNAPLRPFGDSTWEDVRRYIHRRLQERFPAVSEYDIEDATGYALVDLLDYWIHLPGSVRADDPRSTFRLAVKRGTWRGCEFMQHALHYERTSAHLNELPEAASTDPADLVDAQYDEEEARRLAVGLVGELDEKKFEWLRGYLAGLTTREEAAIQNCSQSRVTKRRRKAVAALRKAAQDSGLIEAP